MEFEYRHQLLGLVSSLALFVTYWIIVIARAITDDLSFTKVAWQGPLLLIVGVGGALYAIIYGAARWRVRGKIVTDERDAEITRRADAAGAGLTSLAALIAMIMLALDADTFWVVHVIFVGSFLGTVASAGMTVAAYTEGLER